jgi:hypothetical protein
MKNGSDSAEQLSLLHEIQTQQTKSQDTSDGGVRTMLNWDSEPGVEYMKAAGSG